MSDTKQARPEHLDILDTTYRVAREILIHEGGQDIDEPDTQDSRLTIARQMNSAAKLWAQARGDDYIIWRIVWHVQNWLAGQGYYGGNIDGRPGPKLWLAEQVACQDRGWARDPDPIPQDLDLPDSRQMALVHLKVLRVDFWKGGRLDTFVPLELAEQVINAFDILAGHHHAGERRLLGLGQGAAGQPGEIIIAPNQNRPHWRQDRATNALPQMAAVHQALRGAGYHNVGVWTNQHWHRWTSVPIPRPKEGMGNEMGWFGDPALHPRPDRATKTT